MSNHVLRVWIITSFVGDEVLFYEDAFENLGKRLGVQIELKMIAWTRAFDYLMEAFKNGNPPDVFQVGTTWVNTMAYLGYLATAPKTFECRTALAGWLDEGSQYQGIRVATPWLVDTTILTARKDIMDEYGIKPSDIQDWTGFLKVCSELSSKNTTLPEGKKKVIPLAMSIRPEIGTLHRYMSILLTQGWEFPALNPIPERILTTQDSIKALEYVAQIMLMGGVKKEDTRVHPQQMYQRFFLKGDYAFYIGNWGRVIADSVKDRKTERQDGMQFTILPLPVVSRDAKFWGGGSMLAVSSTSSYPKIAWNVIQYMLQNDFLQKWTALSGNLPAFGCDFWDKNRGNSTIQSLYTQLAQSKSYPQHPLWRSVEQILSKGVADCLWYMIENGSGLICNKAYTIIEKTDESILNLLKMAWNISDAVECPNNKQRYGV